MSAPELDHDPAHTRLLKGAVEFFANQVAHLFRMGRCAECAKCAASVGNLGLYFTKCLGRALDIDFEGQVQVVLRQPAPGVPPAPSDASGDGSLN